ncbi:MAG TPA: AAA family ATPase [Anaerolineae bacterium]|nr:AAA family ATPase [Anaerolineae bacterium]HRV92992.1 AAA family ATPase [Anaerolineae bacterium]
MDNSRPDIIFIGPYGAGKTTLAELISKKLNWPHYSLDGSNYRYYLKMIPNYDSNIVDQMDLEKLSSLEQQRYDVFVIEKFLKEHSNEVCVFDFGVGHSVYDNDECFEQIQQILFPYINIVLILPSPSQEESLEILLDQIRKHWAKGDGLSDTQINEINKYVINHHSNYDLAKMIVYTKGKSSQETSEEIHRKLVLEN